MTEPIPYRGRLEAEVGREGTSITAIDVETDANGTITRFSLSLDPEATVHHVQVRVSIFTPEELRYDEVLDLPSAQSWLDVMALCEQTGVPLPGGIDEPGTQVRVGPFDGGERMESREALALEVTLDAPMGETRHVVGRWEAEWPSSLWLCGVVTGHEGRLRRAFAVAREEIFELGILWRVFRTGEQDRPLLDSWLGAGQAAVVWDRNGFAGIDLTPDLATIAWLDMGEAVLEMEALSPADPDARPRVMRLPITAR